MLISVIIPVYNVEKYLRECLDSVLHQTYKKLEVILVDDGSTDGSGRICDEYAERYPYFRVIHKKNAGLGMARNSGLETATGEYVYFLDSDDYIESTQIEELYHALVIYHVDACRVGFKAVDDEKNLLYERKYQLEVFPGERARTDLLPRMLGSSSKSQDSIEMSASAQLYAMRPIKEHQLSFCSERELISEDLVFNIDYMQYADGACTLDSTGNYYRQNPSSLSHSYLENRFEKSKSFYSVILKKLQEFGYGPDAFQRLQKSFFINVRMSISQELKDTSPHDRQTKKTIIRNICKDEMLQDIISGYPIKELGLQQKIFLFLVRHQMVIVLKVLLRMKNM